MLSLYKNPYFPAVVKSDSRMSPKSYFDRLFEDSFETAFADLFKINAHTGIESKKNEDGTLSIIVEVPGVQESDLAIELVNNLITIKGQRKTATSSYELQKCITISEGYDTDNISAELKNGILNITIGSKTVPKEIKQIPINTSK